MKMLTLNISAFRVFMRVLAFFLETFSYTTTPVLIIYTSRSANQSPNSRKLRR